MDYYRYLADQTAPAYVVEEHRTPAEQAAFWQLWNRLNGPEAHDAALADYIRIALAAARR